MRPNVVEAGGDSGGHLRPSADVGDVRAADAALALDDALRLGGGVGIDVDAEDPRAFAREQHRDRLAVAPARARPSRSR